MNEEKKLNEKESNEVNGGGFFDIIKKTGNTNSVSDPDFFIKPFHEKKELAEQELDDVVGGFHTKGEVLKEPELTLKEDVKFEVETSAELAQSVNAGYTKEKIEI